MQLAGVQAVAVAQLLEAERTQLLRVVVTGPLPQRDLEGRETSEAWVRGTAPRLVDSLHDARVRRPDHCLHCTHARDTHLVWSSMDLNLRVTARSRAK